MSRSDDLLNVYAYLFSKSQAVAKTAKNTADALERLDSALDNMDARLDQMQTSLDASMAEAYRLAAELGIDTSGIAPQITETELSPPEPVCAELRPELPADFDFQKDFRRLVKEAHQAGFTQVYPEQLLSPQEIARANAAAQQLDDSFAAATRLQKKDIMVLTIAVAIRVTCHFLSLAISEGDSSRSGEAADSRDPRMPEPAAGSPVDATQGVDIGDLLNQAGKYQGGLKSHDQIMDKVMQTFGGGTQVLDHATILAQSAPFDIQETDLFEHKDIAAYNPYLGWIVGVLNILTDTITTFNTRSYCVIRPFHSAGKPQVDNQVSTLFGVILPVVQALPLQKDAVIAATIQESLVLGFSKAAPDQVRPLFLRAMELEHSTALAARETASVLGEFWDGWAAGVGGIAMTTMINTIVSAIHSLVYEEKDGDLSLYAIRTNRILLYSGAMATVINSLPALAARDIRALDHTGILMTCISLFQSTKFWIDAKTEFLISAYKQELDKELYKVNAWFSS